MPTRNLTREQALEEYLIYRIRLRELLDMGQVLRDIKECRYAPHRRARGSEEFSDTVGHALMGLFASLLDPQSHALDAFDVWLVLFPRKKGKINKTWKEVKPHVQLIRDYRNDIACHANKSLRRYGQTLVKFQDGRSGIVKAMQAVIDLAAELRRDEPTAIPKLRSEIEPILKKCCPTLSAQQIEGLKDYFLA
ncbi:MAG: hypothetical protein ACRD18_08095 [Terriglobia bacterium]